VKFEHDLTKMQQHLIGQDGIGFFSEGSRPSFTECGVRDRGAHLLPAVRGLDAVIQDHSMISCAETSKHWAGMRASLLRHG
jgi:hypothetical protein